MKSIHKFKGTTEKGDTTTLRYSESTYSLVKIEPFPGRPPDLPFQLDQPEIGTVRRNKDTVSRNPSGSSKIQPIHVWVDLSRKEVA